MSAEAAGRRDAARGVAGASLRPVALWLFLCCAMIFLMVAIGGITRLTLSGLSITEWRPVTGIVPPLSAADWHAEFIRYQQIPQYKLVTHGMTLAEFKTIFLWEYVHRLWGRLIGIVYLVPLVWFVARRHIPRRLVVPLAGIFALGAAQGALGWYMVESGLANRVEVSQYRLTAHLLLALAIYAATLWAALGLWQPLPEKPSRPNGGVRREGLVASGIPHLTPTLSAPRGREGVAPQTSVPAQRAPSPASGGGLRWGPGWRRASEALIALVGLTIAAGGFTAGLHAGLVYNTFPLMDGRIVPEGYAQLHPFVRNWFENIAAVQFDHRLLATATASAVVALWLAGQRASLPWPARLALHALLAAVALQFTLGVSTLLFVVPVPLAATHQCGAVILLTASLVWRHTLRRAPELDAAPAAAL